MDPLDPRTRTGRLPALPDRPLGGHLGGEHPRRRRRRRHPARHLARVAAGAVDLLQLGQGGRQLPGRPRRALAQHPDHGDLRRDHRGARPAHRRRADAARPRLLSVAPGGHALRRPLPRAAAHPRPSPARLRRARAAAAGPADRRPLLGLRRARALLHGLCRRGLPGRDRVGAPLPAGRGALARAHLRPVAALRRRAAGRAPGHAAAHERRCVAAEGLRPHLDPRRRRCGAGRADRDVLGLQLHPVCRRRGPLHLPDDPDGAAHRLGGAAAGLPGRGRLL